VKAGLDATGWTFALVLAVVVRYDFHLPRSALFGLAVLLPLVLLIQVASGLAFGLYRGRWVFGSFEEVAALTRAVVLTTIGAVGVDALLGEPRMVPFSSAVGAGFIALVCLSGVRYMWRLHLESRRSAHRQGENRMLIFGAGDGGAQVIRAMRADRRETYRPVALLDDDPGKRNLRIGGVRVVGDRYQIAAASRRYDAKLLLIAVPKADRTLIAEVSALAEQAGLRAKVLPPVSELISGGVDITDIRDISLTDLLGRHEIHTDLESIAGYLTGKRVLVSGAGGSIGSELCRQLRRFAPVQLIMLDRDESALHALQLSLNGRAAMDSPDLVVADIRDSITLKRVFARCKPQVVFHAAALKHLTLLERHPTEALRTNVLGALNMLEAAAMSGVNRFVNVSTDKAADPCNVLGYTKRATERITSFFNSEAQGTYLSVRFGNVLGSRGSVLDTFSAQLAAGGPITVTHPEVTRFFMTTEEAVQLLIQAGAIGRDGEVLVLNMGSPVRIDDVARRLGAATGRSIEIVYTGLRPGEKLEESLFGQGEFGDHRVHPLISHVEVPGLDPAVVLRLNPLAEAPELVNDLRAACTETMPGLDDKDSMVSHELMA
jgi:FlaA1/EpsC-like NDP-sugar epimerase